MFIKIILLTEFIFKWVFKVISYPIFGNISLTKHLYFAPKVKSQSMILKPILGRKKQDITSEQTERKLFDVSTHLTN